MDQLHCKPLKEGQKQAPESFSAGWVVFETVSKVKARGTAISRIIGLIDDRSVDGLRASAASVLLSATLKPIFLHLIGSQY
jgi:hypothetical protein